jgi:hypothetical protein
MFTGVLDERFYRIPIMRRGCNNLKAANYLQRHIKARVFPQSLNKDSPISSDRAILAFNVLVYVTYYLTCSLV